MTTAYFVRPGMVLHRQIIQRVKGKEVRSTKPYQGGDALENLTESEAKKYKHLIETEEQVKSREPKATKNSK
ncbi:MAG: hypothetical protein AAFQ41_00355 [Cyanobacteria bacterium J06623_7]